MVPKDPWRLFRSTRMGDNIEEVVETPDCKVLRLTDISGEGTMTMYRIFDGVYLMYNDFHLRHCVSHFSSPECILCIDHCREGRIEHRTSGGMLYYMEPGDMRVDHRVHHEGKEDFPLCHYHGITISFHLALAEAAIREAMPDISVDLSALSKKYRNDENPFVMRKEPAVEHIFSELYNVPSRIRMDYFKIKVMELLIYLAALEIDPREDHKPYFYSSQTEKVKAIHELLVSDLTRNYTTEELAQRFGMTVNTLKNCFKGVYGSPIFTYIRTYRMNYAASLLAQKKELKIGEVAAMVGYDNPSKFSAAFRETMGITPVQYRNHTR